MPSSRVPFLNKLSDFSNVFKAFIGVNYLSLPFAFKESGLILGIISLCLIAILTDHCCLLIIKCKRAMIDKIMDSSTCYSVHAKNTKDHMEAEKKKKQEKRSILEKTMTYGDIGNLTMGKWGYCIVNTALVITQFGACINYFIFMGDTITQMFPRSAVNGTDNSSSLLMENKHKHKSVPSFILLMLIPFPIFLLLTFIRKVRSIGPFSAIASVCVFLGFFSILGFILNGLDLHNIHKVKYWDFSTLPIFFGQIIGAFEGIGTIIPVEASMSENRPNFTKYLHGAILGVTVILATFGIFGYLHYMDNVKQLISDNLEYGTLSIVVQVTLCIGILCTYPLAIFPAVEIIENILFKDTKERNTLISSCNEDYNGLFQGIINADLGPDDGVDSDQERSFANEGHQVPLDDQVIFKESRCSFDMGWSTWKRNIVRTLLVILSFGLGYAGRNYYAYIFSLSGAIGSSLLAFVLPCSVHLIIKKDSLSGFIIAKDVLLILFGTIAGLVGFVTILIKMIKS